MENTCEIGMIGLGVMGRNFVLNIAEHGYAVAGYDKDSIKIQELRNVSGNLPVSCVDTLQQLIAMLRKPRIVMLLVPAGPIIDNVIKDIIPYLDKDDMIVDGGNSLFKDSEVRELALASKGIKFLGVGISGGEHGARHGPSLMPGGEPDAYERIRALFESCAAKVDGDPCVAYLGKSSAGHYTKMVHNGIEYGFMELIAETYDLMHRGMGLNDDQLAEIYERWNHDELKSYLLEITTSIFREFDKRTSKHLIDVILDEASQKGTGRWACQDAMELNVPLSIIDAAVARRNISAYKSEREQAARLYGDEVRVFEGNRQSFLDSLREALIAAVSITFAQCMNLLAVASQAYGFGIQLESVARIWRGGCIIRMEMLENIRTVFRKQPECANLLLDQQFGSGVINRREHLCTIINASSQMRIAVPAFAIALAYLDSYRSAWIPANLIQAQRDYFGAHSYERIDAPGVFHTKWEIEGKITFDD